jgi:site-specific recombinase XerD
MLLSQRENKIFYLYYLDETGRRQKRSTGTSHKTAAIRYLDDFVQRRNPPPPLSTFLTEYLAFAESRYSHRTVKSYTTACNRLVQKVGDTLLTEYTPQVLDHFLSEVISETSLATARTYRACLSSMFETARRWRYIQHNPFTEVKRPEPGDRMPAWFTVEEFKKFLSMIDDERFRDLAIVALYIGMRAQELRQLTRDSIDLKRKTITVMNRQGARTKNKRSRVIPMHNEVIKIMRRRLRSTDSDFVFFTRGGQLRYWYPSRKFREYADTAGLHKRYSFHSLRHSFGSILASRNVSLVMIQRLMGHSPKTGYLTTTQLYTHINTAELQNAIAKIPNL